MFKLLSSSETSPGAKRPKIINSVKLGNFFDRKTKFDKQTKLKKIKNFKLSFVNNL